MDYRFLEKDPVIDLIRTEAEDSLGDLHGQTLEKLALDSGISVGTLRRWFGGETRRPLNMSVRMVLQALHCRVKIIRQDGTEIRGPRHGKGKTNGRKSEARAAQAASVAG